MAGRIAVDEEPAPRHWDRFALEFADGGRLALRDKRRLGRARDRARLLARRARTPPRSARDVFRERVGRGTIAAEGAAARPGRRSPASATCSPTRRCGARGSRRGAPAGELSVEELDRLRRELRAATRDAIRKGGVHTGRLHPAPRARRHLPALRDAARARDDRRAHHVLVPALPARRCGGAGGAEAAELELAVVDAEARGGGGRLGGAGVDGRLEVLHPRRSGGRSRGGACSVRGS